MRSRFNENLLFSFAGLGAVSAFFGAVILWSVARGGFSLVSFWGVAGFSFFILGLLAVGYSVYLSGRPATVLSVALLIFVGGFLSNMAYDFSARSRSGNTFRISVVDESGRVLTLGPDVFGLFSVLAEDLGRYAELFCDARLRWEYPPRSLPSSVSFSVQYATYVDIEGDNRGFALWRNYNDNPVLSRWAGVHYPGSSTRGWKKVSDNVVVSQTDRIPLFTISGRDSVFDVGSKVRYCFRISVNTRVGELSYLVQSEPYVFHIDLLKRSDDSVMFVGFGSGCG